MKISVYEYKRWYSRLGCHLFFNKYYTSISKSVGAFSLTSNSRNYKTNPSGYVLDTLRIKAGLEPQSCHLFLEIPEITHQNPGTMWDIMGLLGLVEGDQLSSQMDWEFKSQLCQCCLLISAIYLTSLNLSLLNFKKHPKGNSMYFEKWFSGVNIICISVAHSRYLTDVSFLSHFLQMKSCFGFHFFVVNAC